MLNYASTDEIKDKVVYLIQFFSMYFEKDKDLLPNFYKIYEKALEGGVKFPPPSQSQYQNMKINQNFGQNQNMPPMQPMRHQEQSFNPNVNQNPFASNQGNASRQQFGSTPFDDNNNYNNQRSNNFSTPFDSNPNGNNQQFNNSGNFNNFSQNSDPKVLKVRNDLTTLNDKVNLAFDILDSNNSNRLNELIS